MDVDQTGRHQSATPINFARRLTVIATANADDFVTSKSDIGVLQIVVALLFFIPRDNPAGVANNGCSGCHSVPSLFGGDGPTHCRPVSLYVAQSKGRVAYSLNFRFSPL